MTVVQKAENSPS